MEKDFMNINHEVEKTGLPPAIGVHILAGHNVSENISAYIWWKRARDNLGCTECRPGYVHQGFRCYTCKTIIYADHQPYNTVPPKIAESYRRRDRRVEQYGY